MVVKESEGCFGSTHLSFANHTHQRSLFKIRENLVDQGSSVSQLIAP